MITLPRSCLFALATVLVLACATTRTTEEQIDDNNVTMSVGSKLTLDPEIDRYRIDIDTLNGVVTLRGSVKNEDQREEVKRITEHTTGVLEVVDQLTIDTEPRSASSRFEDGWITIMIDSKLTVDPEVKSRNVNIHVVEGVVTLSGIVETDIARSEAAKLAGSVDGVVRVVNDLTVGS